MTNSSLTLNSTAWEYIFNISTYNPTLITSFYFNLITVFIISILTLITCIFGIVANGLVIWLLGFCMKRNPFTTYILNLAIADLGVLITSGLAYIFIITLLSHENFSPLGLYASTWVYSLTYITDQLLLTAISVDRCVAVLFPLWHRCHRPPRLPSIVCIFIWVLSFVINGSDILLDNHAMLLSFIVNVAICTPLMAASTLILFVRMCTKSRQHKRGKLLTVISLALFLFLLFGFPVNYLYFLTYYYFLDGVDITSLWSSDLDVSDLNFTVFYKIFFRLNMVIVPAVAAVGGAVLNCSVNPVIYFLVGRKKKGQSRLSMKVALQRVFMEEDNCRGQEELQTETQF